MTSITRRTQVQIGQLGGIALVNLATLTWATNMVLGRSLRDEVGPLTLAAARFLIASALFAVFLQQRPPVERQLGGDRRPLLAMACSVVLFAPMLYLGLRRRRRWIDPRQLDPRAGRCAG